MVGVGWSCKGVWGVLGGFLAQKGQDFGISKDSLHALWKHCRERAGQTQRELWEALAQHYSINQLTGRCQLRPGQSIGW